LPHTAHGGTGAGRCTGGSAHTPTMSHGTSTQPGQSHTHAARLCLYRRGDAAQTGKATEKATGITFPPRPAATGMRAEAGAKTTAYVAEYWTRCPRPAQVPESYVQRRAAAAVATAAKRIPAQSRGTWRGGAQNPADALLREPGVCVCGGGFSAGAPASSRRHQKGAPATRDGGERCSPPRNRAGDSYRTKPPPLPTPGMVATPTYGMLFWQSTTQKLVYGRDRKAPFFLPTKYCLCVRVSLSIAGRVAASTCWATRILLSSLQSARCVFQCACMARVRQYQPFLITRVRWGGGGGATLRQMGCAAQGSQRTFWHSRPQYQA
jgi:hypothetical protein